MKIVVEKSCQAVGREQWNYLVSQNATNTIFQTYEWHLAFEAAYSGGYYGYILCGIEENLLVGVAPFCICKTRKENVIRFLGYERADYCDFIYLKQKNGFIAEVFSFLKKSSSKWDRMELKNIPEKSPTYNLISAACASFHLFPYRGKKIPCPALLFKDKDRPYKEILKKKSLVYYHNYFSKKQNFRVSHYVGKEEVTRHLQAFFDQHIARWSAVGFPSLFLQSCHQEFYRNLTKELDSSGWMLFTELCLDDCPVAFHFGFIYNGKLVLYKPTFDILLSNHSPGVALLKELMLFIEKNGLNELDFTVGDEAYKKRFSNIIRCNVSFDIFINPIKFSKYGMLLLVKEIFRRLPSAFQRVVLSVFEKEMESGIRGLLRKTLFFLRMVLFRRSGVIVFSRQEARQDNLKKEFGNELFKVRPGTLEDVIRFSEYLSAKKRLIAIGDAVRWFKEGGMLFVAVHHGALAGIAWVFGKESIEISEVAYRFEMPKNSIMITSYLIAPEFPRTHIFLALIKSICHRFSDNEKIIYCDEKNVASHSEIEQLFIGSKIIRMVSLFGIRFHFSKSFLAGMK